ncbi:MAG: LacI family DNA-binding transcriptional regulator [Planctomycetes bacterium]|nr:LacI family DNA-binding transcriptional regulator [Planctomycetota bacterium]
MVTLKEVAAAANVSTVTASSVLSGVNRVRVSPATAERIHRVAKSMNYVPLAAARGLRTGKTRIIAFVTSSYSQFRSDDVWHESLRGVSDLMGGREDRPRLGMSRNREHEMEIIRQMAYGRQVDGFIIQDSGEIDEQIELLRQSERPFVLMGGTPRPEVNSVSFDMRAFASDIAESLDRNQCGAAILVSPGNANKQVFSPFLDFFGEWEKTRGITCHHWNGAFVPDSEWLGRVKADLNGKKLGVALLRGLLPEMIAALDQVGLPIGSSANIVYVSTGEDILLAPDGIEVMHFDNYTLGRRAARLLLGIVDKGKEAGQPENIIIPAAQKG